MTIFELIHHIRACLVLTVVLSTYAQTPGNPIGRQRGEGGECVSKQGTSSGQNRLSKNKRYNGGVTDLVEAASERRFVIDNRWPATDLMPVSDSDIVLSGTVVSCQAFLSNDRTQIYSELTIKPDVVYKSPKSLEGSSSIVLDRLGGIVVLASGQEIEDPTAIRFLGWPQIGKTYILFGKYIHKKKDLSIIRGFELSGEDVLSMYDGSPISSLPGVPSSYRNKATFIEALQKRKQRARK